MGGCITSRIKFLKIPENVATLYIYVGGTVTSGGYGGWNGGGNGLDPGGYYRGGGGGGASDIRVIVDELSSRILTGKYVYNKLID